MKFKIPTEHGRYYCKDWLELYDGGSDQWLYVCRDSLAYVFIDIMDWPAYCGRDATCRWVASVSMVDLLTISPETIAGSLRSCGFEEELDFKLESDRLRIAEMCFTTGAKAPMWEESGGKVTFDDYGNLNESYDENCPHFRRLRKEAREYAEQELLKDDEYRNELLNTKIVNAIGSTAREMMDGDIWAPLRRIKEQGEEASKEQRLVLKMYQNAGTTLGAGPAPEDIMK